MQQVDPSFWKGKRVFLTGHTGFKGSWLSLWLQQMGAVLQGYALAPATNPSLFDEARVAEGMGHTIGDVRELGALLAAMVAFKPEIVIHMAAQPLVRLSYVQPVETYATNVMGTVHLLEAVRRTAGVRAVVNVTTDKCYENKEWVWGYREDEPMGGHDPYSNSKGCSELVTSAYRRSFFGEGGCALASARAGNVIGGGDWALDRLVPDILRAFEAGKSVIVRNPQATRPWQHVLEPLSGYLVLAQALWNQGATVAEGWNFGPDDTDARPVNWICDRMVEAWGNSAAWQLDPGANPHEANFLKLDISKAKFKLGWTPTWELAIALEKIVTWHQAWLSQSDVQALCLAQIEQFVKDSSEK
ncbi:MAG: CDP-glucose 4,6-dehydratase [Nevskiaceae bacterium]|nr:MAG: CDP-glucose 4,6-dehydratase [Nevskiaceae bacterium]